MLSMEYETVSWNRPVWICLAGEQALPNVLPVLAYKPEAVVYLHTDLRDSQAAADRCKQFLKKRGMRVHTRLVDPWDGASVASVIIEEAVRAGLNRILVNWTGGTKPMSLAAYNALGEQVPRVYYDVRKGIKVNQGPFLPVPPVNLSLEDHLYVNAGIKPQRGVVPPRADNAVEALSLALSRAPEETLDRLFLYRREHLAGLKARRGWRLTGDVIPAPLLDGLADALVADGLASRNAGAWKPAPDALDFLEGFWWEAYVARQLQVGLAELGLDEQETNLRTNLTVRWKTKPTATRSVTSEVDAAFVFDNRLHLVSCTTASLADTKKRMEEVESFSRHFGGRFGRAMLACTHRGPFLDELNIQKTARTTVIPHFARLAGEPASVLREWLELPAAQPAPAPAVEESLP